MDHTETELKLALDAQALKRVPRVAAIAAAKQGRAVTKDLVSTYYDTPDCVLRRAGLSLRLRRRGRDWIQTIKQSAVAHSGLFERHEWEIVLALPHLNLPHLLSTGLDIFKQDGLYPKLQPLFSTHVRRTTHILAGEGWEVELALDHGRLVMGEREQAIAEIELEMRHGPAEMVFPLAHAIAAALPCQVLAQAKSDRGYDLAANTAPQSFKAKPLRLSADMTTGQAFAAIARDCVGHLSANQSAIAGPHAAEAIHQMRVALRRLRSALKIFKPLLIGADMDGLRDQIRWVLSQLGPARDAEVFLTEIVAPVCADHAEAPALTQLWREFQRRRDAEVETASQAVASTRFTLMLLELGRWSLCPTDMDSPQAQAPLAGFARQVLRRQWRRVLKAGGKDLGHLPAEQLHQLRILGKQLRYGAEFFASLYPKAKIKPLLTTLASLQQNLGELNDLAVAGPRLARSGQSASWGWAAGLICGWHETRRPLLMKAARQDWKNLRKTTPPWD